MTKTKAARFDAASGWIREGAMSLRESSSEILALVPDDETIAALDRAATLKVLEHMDVKEIIDSIDTGANDIQELAGELCERRDNMQEYFSSTELYQRVESTAEALEELAGTLEGLVNTPTLPEVKDGILSALAAREFAAELESMADEIEGALDDAGDMDFPGARP